MSFNFGTTAVATPAASSGFSFGGSTPAPTAGAAPSSGGFSFGGVASTPASAGFSFGGSTGTVPAPASSGGFNFGGTTTSSAAAPASSGFSFGGSAGAATATPAPAATGFGFGAAPAATTTSSLFGGSAATTGGSMFGAKPAGSSLFGGAATLTPATTSLGGFGGGFGTAAPVATPAQPPIKLETTFDVLPADVKKNMTEFHKFLKDEDQSDAFLKSVSARKLDGLKANLEQLEQDVLVRRNLQDRQATAVHHVRKDVKHLINQVDTATLNLRSMSGESTSQRFYGIMRRVEMPSPYYWELLDNFEARMEQLKNQIENVESEFQPLYEKQRRGGSGYDAASISGMNPALLQQILMSQNSALIQVAAHVAEVHEKTEEMRQAFIRKMKEDMMKHGDTNLAAFKNPFDKKKRNSASRESDIDNIRFKTSVTPTIVATQQPQTPAPTSTGFGSFGTATTGATGFGTTATGGNSLFGAGAAPTISTGTFGTTASAAPAANGGGFNFGNTASVNAAAPKQVSFSLGGSAAPTVSTGGFGFSAPATPVPGATSAAAPGGFGAVGSSFMPASTPAFSAGDKRTAGAASKSGGLRSRQKKR